MNDVSACPTSVDTGTRAALAILFLRYSCRNIEEWGDQQMTIHTRNEVVRSLSIANPTAITDPLRPLATGYLHGWAESMLMTDVDAVETLFRSPNGQFVV